MKCKICNPKIEGNGYCAKHSTSGTSYTSKHNKEWEKEFDELPKSKLTTKQFIAKTLKAQKFALEKEYSWSYGRLLRKELKAKDKEFIEIIKCKNCKGKGEVFVDMASTECSDCGGDGHCIKSKEGWNINQLIKQKDE